MNNNTQSQIQLGFAITGSFCTYSKILEILEKMPKEKYNIIPIFSENGSGLDNRFHKAKDFVAKVESITGNQGIYTIPDAEPIGPKGYLDALVIAPCTGNTLAKPCNGITDSTVLMAAKAHLRNEKPLIISISTNDALGMNFKNLGQLMNTKNIYFVPFGQDNYQKKSNSMIAHVELIPQTIDAALSGKQIQPVIQSPFTL